MKKNILLVLFTRSFWREIKGYFMCHKLDFGKNENGNVNGNGNKTTLHKDTEFF